jgi:hypothetical protein
MCCVSVGNFSKKQKARHKKAGFLLLFSPRLETAAQSLTHPFFASPKKESFGHRIERGLNSSPRG